jgi:pimeloyl-ACP methyl ester carboxylesterase
VEFKLGWPFSRLNVNDIPPTNTKNHKIKNLHITILPLQPQHTESVKIMSKTTIIFVHGAWHNSEYFSKTIALLEPLGYRCITVDLPAVNSSPPVTSLTEDIETIRAAVEKEVESGHELMVHVHSWGGIPATSALDGLSLSERQQGGKVGGVVNISYVSPFLFPAGVSLEQFIGGPSSRPDWWVVSDDVSKCIF